MSKKLLGEVEQWMSKGMNANTVSQKLKNEFKCTPEQVAKYLQLAQVKTKEAPRPLTEQEKLKPRDTKDFQNFQQNKVREETSMQNQGLKPIEVKKQNPWGMQTPAPIKDRKGSVSVKVLARKINFR